MSGLRRLLERVFPPRHALFYLQRMVLHPPLRAAIARLVAKLLPARTAGDADPEGVRRVRDDGYLILERYLSTDRIADIVRYLEDRRVRDDFGDGQARFRLEEAPEGCHAASYAEEDIVGCPHVLEIANDPRIVSMVEEVLGCRPTVSNLHLWWSLPDRGRRRDAQLFHRDVDDWAFLKLFIYLTDVDEGSGPHGFVRSSHRVSKLLPIRRYQDEEVVRAFGEENLRLFCGAAGTAILENTFGLHKGQQATSRRRLILQIQYSLLPVFIYRYPASRPRGSGVDRWMNRLYWEADGD